AAHHGSCCVQAAHTYWSVEGVRVGRCFTERHRAIMHLHIETPDTREALMAGHPQDVLDSRRKFELRQAFSKLRRTIEEHLIQLLRRTTYTLDFVRRLYGPPVTHGGGTIDNFRFRKILGNLLVGCDR